MSLSVTSSDEFLTSTMQARLKKMRNMQFRPHRVTEVLMQMADQEDGGFKMQIPWDVTEHSVTTQHTTGFEDVDLTIGEVLTSGQDDWGWWVSPVAWSWVDENINRGKHKVISIIETRTENTVKRKEREVEVQVLQGVQDTMSDMNTWNGDDVATGFFESAAPGTQNNVVHGVSKLTHAGLPQFQNQFVDILGSFSTNGLPQLIRLHNRVRQTTDDPTNIVGFGSFSGVENYITTVQQQERYGEGGADVAKKLDIVINNVVYKQSALMPNGGTVTGVANQEWSFLPVDMSVVKFVAQSGLKMNMLPFRDLTGARLVKVALLQLAGQNACHAWGSSGIGRGGDTL